MDFTFGICTTYSDTKRLKEIIDSIIALNIPNYEILIIGDKNKTEAMRELSYSNRVKHYMFDESIRPGWITRKKNILIQEASNDNIVLFHDYYVFDSKWYDEYVKFGDDWEICSNAQLLMDGKRHFTDWVVWDDPILPRYTSIDYSDWSRTPNMYISGGYFLVKKHVGLKTPLNENMIWGTPEDVEWSLRVRDKYLMKCNGNSIVKHNKKHRDLK